jgi:hypothetical protein
MTYATRSALGTILGAAAIALAGCGGASHHRSASASVTPAAGAVPAADHVSHRPVKPATNPKHAAPRPAPAHTSPRPKPKAKAKASKVGQGFSATATGNPGALRALASTVPGGSGQSVFASTNGSKARFISSADRLCRSFRSQVRTIGAHATTLKSQENELSDIVHVTSAALARFRKLAPPRADVALAVRFVRLTGTSVDDFVQAQSRSTSKSESVGTANERRDMNLADTSARNATAADAVARKLGFHVCGSEGAEWL